MALHASMYVRPDGEEIEAALQGLVAQNRVIMRRRADEGRPLPRVYASGLVWHREAPGHEDWQDYLSCLQRKQPCDCEDLAAARAAELQEDGEDADVYVYRSRKNTYHVVVRRGDGRIEDPSRITLALARRRQGVGR